MLPYAFPLNEYGNFWTSDSAGTFGGFISFCRNRSTRRRRSHLFSHTSKKRLYKSDFLTCILRFVQNLNAVAKKKKTMLGIYRIAGACRTRRVSHCKRVVCTLIADYKISVFFFFFYASRRDKYSRGCLYARDIKLIVVCGRTTW